jgi:thiol-disulfide isomerase/thioredoxin
MVKLDRRIILGAGCTVLATGLACKLAWTDDAAPHVAMRPLSEIERQTPPAALPALRFATLDGTAKTLADFHGKPVLLNFWATWCGPCVAELPELDRLAATDPSLSVIAVSTDRGGAGVVKPFLAAHGVTHATILLDHDSDAVHTLGVAGFPTTLLIDADGKLRGKLEGPADWGSAAATIEGLVKG